MRTIISLLLISLFVLVSCRSGTYYSCSFPWNPAGPGESQEKANDLLYKQAEYHGNFIIYIPPIKRDSNGTRVSRIYNYRIKIYANLKNEKEDPIYEKSFRIDAYDLDVVERSGGPAFTRIVCEDKVTKQQWVFYFIFDATTKKLKLTETPTGAKES